MGIYVLFGIIALLALKKSAEGKSGATTPTTKTPSANVPKPPSPYTGQGCLYAAVLEEISWQGPEDYPAWIEWAEDLKTRLGPGHPGLPIFQRVIDCLQQKNDHLACVAVMAEAVVYERRHILTDQEIEDYAKWLEEPPGAKPHVAACLRDKSKW